MGNRITIRHDVGKNWDKAVNFVPAAGELVLYDGVMENGEYVEVPRLKIGDGVTRVTELPFIVAETEDGAVYEYDDDNETLNIDLQRLPEGTTWQIRK